MEDLFDFGFTAVDEDELDAVVAARQEAVGTDISLEDVQQRLDRLYNAVTPLLNNLKANPDKDYILWPNRLAKVELFETKLQEIYSGGS